MKNSFDTMRKRTGSSVTGETLKTLSSIQSLVLNFPPFPHRVPSFDIKVLLAGAQFAVGRKMIAFLGLPSTHATIHTQLALEILPTPQATLQHTLLGATSGRDGHVPWSRKGHG